MRNVVKEEDDDVRHTGGGEGYDMDMEQDDMIDDSDEVEFGNNNIPTLSNPLRTALPASSNITAGPTSRRLSPSSSRSAYGQREVEIRSVGGGVYTRSGNHVSREYDLRETRNEENNSYLRTAYHT